MTTTQIKFIVTVHDNGFGMEQKTFDGPVLDLLSSIHRSYVAYVMNPLSSLNTPIFSAQFDAELETCVLAYNSSSNSKSQR